MIADQGHDLERRASVFAALADPSRLRIVDLLAVGDAASSELSGRLRIPSNLLAHHMRILEAAGLVARRRSEGDGRRSYWRLVPRALEGLGTVPVSAPPRVVFVCTANSARSHLAAALWRRASRLPADSAGTHPAPAIHPRALAVARRRGLPLPARRPRRLEDVVRDGDLLVTVCDRAHEELGGASSLHWSVADPVPIGTDAAFDAAFDELAARVASLDRQLDHSS